ncbi:hypothetical protein G647_05650 [Cladophialophora carrionii CBS 160.54]|uniref:Uncharacterized protein n=1 Tax=Cladophialophora carrionii CBS 160.54 TaxID=1279043 RepID=V9DBZ9_9EURO|nr:uncharacterized protein G647_05650 [Cladophialophora carrionii CBS 160.54]ETI23843.1 hypothetical protein G647_05650 [Cladophialophora carrionii CBS 160.54]
MSPPPVPVDQVQTKRMVQRQASSGSLSNSARGRGRGGLQRQSSSGSMTERTFRTPSPSPSRPVSRSEPPAPPIPTIPQHFAPPATAPIKKKKKRASSQEAPPPRDLSPSLVRPNNRGQSLDRYGSSQPPAPPASAPRNSYVPQSNDLERTDSRNSVNFSRPLSPRSPSPMAQPSVAQSPVLANGDRMNGNAKPSAVAAVISPVQAASIQHDLAQTANQPVKKKKKKIAGGTVEGIHLQSGTMASHPVVTPFEPDPERQQPSLSEDQPPGRRTKKRAAVSGENTHFSVAESPRSDSDSDSNVERKREKRTQRASGILQKQPSIVREDWEGEQQEQGTPPQDRPLMDPRAQDGPTLTQDKHPINAANVSRKIGEPVPLPTTTDRPRSPEQSASAAPAAEDSPAVSMNHLQASGPQPTRGTSLSPSRSTRFSDRLSSDLAAGRKHEPPPRSISPAKPALKHSSPAPSAADGQVRGSSVTPSESSDISSASFDGPPRRKKSVRVSFDAQPEIVGTPVNDSSPVGSPGKERKSWLGLGKNKPPLNTIPSNGDMEELMKPRPQLPSFGSVRGQKFKDTNDSNTAQTPRSPAETRSPLTDAKILSHSGSSSEASSAHIAHTTGVSSDHAVGALLAQEAQTAARRNAQSQSNEPLPPEVRSVEGVLSYSDEESDASEADATMSITPTPAPREVSVPTMQKATPALTINQQVTAPVQPVTPQRAQTVQPPQTEVPVVAVSPPTPGEEHGPRDQYLVVVPGGFPVSAESLAKLDESNRDPQGRKAAAEESDEDVSDNDSIYSDAAEDPSEMERMGFASIDAILESPVAPPPRHDIPPPESPLAHVPAPVGRPLPSESWEETRARWSGIAHQTRQGPSQEVTGVDKPVLAASVPIVQSTPQVASGQMSERANPPNATSVYDQVSQPAQASRSAQSPALQPAAKQPRRKKKTPAAIAAAASVPAASAVAQGLPDSPLRQKNQSSPYPAVATPSLGHTAAAAAPFRHSMRASSPPEVEPGFRRTMRNESRKSMPAPASAVPQQRTAPPAVITPPSQPRAALQKKHIPLATAAAVQAPIPWPKPAPQRVTNDSDSESSFRKARRSKSTSGGKYTMRRSMRGAADPTLRGDTRNGARSVSPVGRRPFSPPDSSRPMRTTLRASIDNTPTLRGSAETRRSSSMLGRQQRSNPPLPTAFKQNNRSRILDSDDSDDEPRPSKFRSRFDDDSDDEVEVPQFAPVRGIPRRNNDDESTDLDDSSEEDQPTPAAKTPPKLQVPQGHGSAPASSTEALSPNSEKKRGLLGLFRSKKPKDEALSPVAESPQASTLPKTPTDTSKPSRLGFSSAAERDRMIEQTRAKLEAAKEQEHPGGHQHGHAKLQRRHMPERVMSDSWPLPSTLADEKPRPTTADGPPTRNGTTRLNQGSMRNTSQSGEAIGRSGKKKKFPMLRKVFGLTD